MRAILIDPEKTAISEIEIAGNDFREVQGLIGCRSFTSGSRPLRGNMSTGFDGLYVSDDDLEDRDDPRFWFPVDADRNPPSSYPIAGRGLVTGVDAMGATCDAGISLEDLASRIRFSRRKFRGFKIRKGRGKVVVGGVEMVELIDRRYRRAAD
jgi:hypothetical protein